MQFSVTFNATMNWLIIKWMKQRVEWSSKRTTWLNRLTHTWENSGWEGIERVRSNTKPGEFWDTGVEADGCGLEAASVSIGSSFSPALSSGGSEVSIGSSAPDTGNSFLPPFNSWPPLSIYFRSLKSAKSHLPCSFSASVGELGTIKGVLEKLSGVGAT